MSYVNCYIATVVAKKQTCFFFNVSSHWPVGRRSSFITGEDQLLRFRVFSTGSFSSVSGPSLLASGHLVNFIAGQPNPPVIYPPQKRLIKPC